MGDEKTLPVVLLAKVRADMHGGFGARAKAGWLAALDAAGTVKMAAGKGARTIFDINVQAQGWTVARIVDGEDVAKVIEAAGPFAYGESSPQREAVRWVALGFDAKETRAWLAARCFDATAAKQLRDAGVTSKQAATKHGSETVAYTLSNGDITLQRAVQLTGRKP